MANVHQNVVDFTSSKAQAQEYPLNLVRSGDFPYVLGNYRSTLDNDEEKLFSRRQNLIVFWDLIASQDKKHIETKFKTTKDLQKALKGAPTDPYRRFIFLQSPSSRDPLACNRQQLALLLTHHQVMAPFLDLVFTFKRREKPHAFTSFRYENYLSSQHHQPGLQSIGRSGIRIQHCFNILGIEEHSKIKGKWLQRQVGAYHSFDLIQGRTVWMIMKGDATMRQRFQSTTQDSASKSRHPIETVEGSFAQTLEDHLLLFQWCVENWASYTESFETDCRHYSSITEHAPVREMVDDIPSHKIMDRQVTFEVPKRQQTAASRSVNSDPSPGPFRRLTTGLSTISSGITRQGSGPYSWGTKPPPAPQMPHLRLEKLASIDQLQGLSLLDKTLDEAISVIDQNKRVLSEIKKHYVDLVNSSAFKVRMTGVALKACQQSTLDFCQKIGRLESDLDNYQGNLRTLLRGLQKMGVLFNCILQYQNMRTAEYFATSSKEATEVMQVWTEQMHEKTMSMHVITVFTLIFLPGTFVAVRTIFSSGILTFGDDGESGGSSMGDWKVRVAGMKLFAAICFPLMSLTLIAWLIAYLIARLKRKSTERVGWDVEAPPDEKKSAIV